MRFLIDAQLPRSLTNRLRDLGYDALHTLDLPLKNKTPDSEIEKISLSEKRVVMTKDADFVNSFSIHKRPFKLPLVSTGNIKNPALENLLIRNVEQIANAFQEHHFIELDLDSMTVHV